MAWHLRTPVGRAGMAWHLRTPVVPRSSYSLASPTRRLYIKQPYFYSRVRRHVDRWQLIILVDESGSMLDSVFHAAVTAAILLGLKALRTHLCHFDTSVVDVTAECTDPVETLL